VRVENIFSSKIVFVGKVLLQKQVRFKHHILWRGVQISTYKSSLGSSQFFTYISRGHFIKSFHLLPGYFAQTKFLQRSSDFVTNTSLTSGQPTSETTANPSCLKIISPNRSEFVNKTCLMLQVVCFYAFNNFMIIRMLYKSSCL